MTAGFFALMAEYQADTARERVGEAQAALWRVEPCPGPGRPWRYRRRGDGTLEVDEATRPIVVGAFEARAEGKSLAEIRKWLKAQGVERSHRGVQELLASRVSLGEIRFGKLVNLQAHEPIIDPDLWRRVQARKAHRGPKPKSKALLARLGVLRCASCGKPMSAAVMPQGGGYPIYRCGSTNDCDRHMVISAELVEREVVAFVKAEGTGITGRASGASGVAEAGRSWSAGRPRWTPPCGPSLMLDWRGSPWPPRRSPSCAGRGTRPRTATTRPCRRTRVCPSCAPSTTGTGSRPTRAVTSSRP